jgi:hypothetical protein
MVGKGERTSPSKPCKLEIRVARGRDDLAGMTSLFRIVGYGICSRRAVGTASRDLQHCGMKRGGSEARSFLVLGFVSFQNDIENGIRDGMRGWHWSNNGRDGPWRREGWRWLVRGQGLEKSENVDRDSAETVIDALLDELLSR